jgi:hypothetical protein
MYIEQNYTNAIKFALNYPQDRDLPLTYSYNEEKDIYKCVLMDGGRYTVKLQGSLVRSALKWGGRKQWIQ